jgi:1,4-alpha-glucan branching enzyme
MGFFTLVAHTHLPYLRKHGVWPVGEDLFHQAASESYLPLLSLLERLGNDGFENTFSLGISPMVATQLADPYMLEELGWFIGRIEPRAMRTVANHGYRTDPDDPPALHPEQVRALAAWHAQWGRARGDELDHFQSTYGNLARAFGAHASVAEILAGPATHPLMPRISDQRLQSLQLQSGIDATRKLTKAGTTGIWLPECHFAPERGLEQSFNEHSVGHLILDGPTVLGALGQGSTFQPWRIKGSDTIAFARDLEVTYRVWSPTGGYPTGRWYRDFYFYDLEGGFKNWRVTSVRKPLHEKQPYDPEAARAAAINDAQDFVQHLCARIEAFERETGRVAHVVAAYDTELFGHWWFEGVIWLEQVLRLLKQTPGVQAVSLQRAKELLPEPTSASFAEGSWGFRKDLRSWVTDETRPMLEQLEAAEINTMRIFRTEYQGASPTGQAALIQALRELMLAQSSDWPFMIVRGRNPGYAWERFNTHLNLIARCLELARSRAPEDLVRRELDRIQAQDLLLPGLEQLAAADFS